MADTQQLGPDGGATRRPRFGYVDTTFGQIHFREMGTGTPILLLHQTASGSVQYRKLLPILADAGYRAIAMDTPGFGQSAPLPEPPRIEAYGQAAAEFLTGLGVERAHVVGVRTGASVAIELAARRPELVGSVTVSGLVAMRTEQERRELAGKPGRYAWTPDDEGRFLDPIMKWTRHFAGPGDGEQFVLEMIAALQAGPTFPQAYDAVVAHDAYGRLAEIRAPLLFLNPRHDPDFVRVEAAHQATPGSRYVEMDGPEGVGVAAVAAVYPQEYARHVLDFVAEAGA